MPPLHPSYSVAIRRHLPQTLSAFYRRHTTTTANPKATGSGSGSGSSGSRNRSLRGNKLGGDTLSFDQFLQRSRVLALYRTICRGTSRIADPISRAETRGFARAEFERHRDVKDVDKIRYLLSVGKTEWDAMERYMG